MSFTSGFYLMRRGWLSNPVLTLPRDRFDRRSAWAWLLENARFADGEVRSEHGVIPLARGQLTASNRFMAKAWGWDEKTVRRFLEAIRKAGMIRRGEAAGQNVITIVNYDDFQDFDRGGASLSASPEPHRSRGGASKKNKGNEGNEGNQLFQDPVQPDFLPKADVVELKARNVALEAFGAWNAMAERYGLSLVKLDPSLASYRRRSDALKKMLREVDGLEGWTSLVERVPNNPWNLGQNDRGWKCTIDYLLDPLNAGKIPQSPLQVRPNKPPAKDYGHLKLPAGAWAWTQEERDAYARDRDAGEARGPIIEHSPKEAVI